MVLPNLTSSQVIRNLAKEFYPPEFKRDVLNIVSIGRLNAQKGFEFALEAALELKKSMYSGWGKIFREEHDSNLL